MSRRVLVADDEPNIVTALEFVLRRAGYEVAVASTGEEALRQLEAQVPDLVLLDVMMPELSGYDVCRRIRERPEWRAIKVVMLSARGREPETRQGMEAGADLYVVKPFSNAELLCRIAALLR
ncbi:MAG TPA: response regulator [Burkholderiales bacterium]|nr:response regulator [Burkholderiales bacterium]